MRRFFSCLVFFLLVCGAVQGMAADFTSPEGWTYTESWTSDPFQAMFAYDSTVFELRNYEYDSDGRIAKAEAYNKVNFTTDGTLTFVYDGDKVFVYHDPLYASTPFKFGTYEAVQVITGTSTPTITDDPEDNSESTASEVVREETASESSRVTNRLIGRRVSSLLAPKPSFIPAMPGASAPRGTGAPPVAPDTPSPGGAAPPVAPGSPDTPDTPGGPNGQGGPDAPGSPDEIPSGGGQEDEQSRLEGAELAYGIHKYSTRDVEHFGLSAGDLPKNWGIWVNGAYSLLGNDMKSTKYDGFLVSTLMGLDYKPLDWLVLGISAGYEHTELDTDFNGGYAYGNGLIIAPYAAVALMENLVWDITGGMTFLQNYAERSTGFFDVDAEFPSYRSMVATNLNWYYLLGNWSFNAGGGFMYTNEHTPEFIEHGPFGFRKIIPTSDAYVGEWSAGGRVGYFLGRFEPYVAVTYLWDPWMSNPDKQDLDEFEGRAGLNFIATSSLLVNMEVANSFFREHVRNTTFMATLRYEF